MQINELVRKTWVFASLFLSLSVQANEDRRGEGRQALEPTGFIYGIGLGVNQQIYQDFEQRLIPIPLIGYRGERLQLFGPFINYAIAQYDALDITVRLAPRFEGFEEADSDVFLGMEERKFSMDAGVGLRYQIDDWKLTLTAMQDILGRSEGYEIQSALGKIITFGPIFVEPSIRISHLDGNFVDYYYGVRQNEVTVDRAFYRGEAATNAALGLSVATPIFFGGMTRIGLTQTYFDDAITESPLTNGKDSVFQVFFSFSKFF